MNPYRDDLTVLSSSQESYTLRQLTTENLNEMVQLGINKLHILEDAMKTGQLKFTETGTLFINPLEKAALLWDIQGEFIETKGRNPTEDEISEIWGEKFNQMLRDEIDRNITASLLGETEQTVSKLNTGKCICKRCGKEYIITDNEKDWFISKGLSIPKNCPNCRKINKRKQQQSSEDK